METEPRDITPGRPQRQSGAAIAQQAQLAAPVENCDALLADLEAVADTGAEALEAAWKAITKEQRKALAGELDSLKARAAGADKGTEYVPE